MNADKTLHRLRERPAWEWPDRSRDAILAGLADGDDDVRRLAAELAARIADDEIATELLRLAEHDPAEDVAAVAALSLGPCLQLTAEAEEGLHEHGPLSPGTFERLKRGLAGLYRRADATAMVRRRALEAAVRAPAPWHAGAVRAAWASGCPFWRSAAVFCMGFVAGFDDELLEALDERDLGIRREAVLAAGRAQLQAAYPEIVHLAVSPATRRPLREAAIHAMAYLDVPLARGLLERLAGGDDPAVAGEAACALKERELSDLDDGGVPG